MDYWFFYIFILIAIIFIFAFLLIYACSVVINWDDFVEKEIIQEVVYIYSEVL